MLNQAKSAFRLQVKKALSQPYRALSRIRNSARHDDEWTVALQSVGSQLETLTSSTETEFLSIGSRLQDFHLHAKDISNMAASLVSLMSSRKMTSAINGLGHILERVKVLQNDSLQGKDMIEDIINTLGRIQVSLCGFKRIVRSLNVLCVAIKTESARLGEEDPGFSSLAKDIKDLALEIDAKSNTILAQSTSLISPIQQTRTRMIDIDTTQREEALVILENTATNVALLTQKHELATSAMHSIVEQSGAITRNIGGVVASLQFHDITRQRIEHVKIGLDELIPRLQGLMTGGNGFKRQEGLSEIKTAGDICELQVAQLRHAGVELAAAVGNILKSLRNISENIAGMSQSTREAVGAASEAGASLGSDMERSLSPIASALSAYSDGIRELVAAVAPLLGTVAEIAAYVKDIERIEIQMRLIALNAIVKASHIDEKGAPLSVLAEEIHQLAVETRGQVATISQSLKSIITVAQELSESVEMQAQAGEVELSLIMQELKDLIESLGRLNDESVSALVHMDEAGRKLSEDIEGLAGEIGVHREFDQKIGEVTSRLDAFVASSRALAPIGGDLERAERLEALESRYTMNCERSIHQAVAASSIPGAAESILLPESETDAGNDRKMNEVDGEDLGDNVELF